jgi:hypothetical protein
MDVREVVVRFTAGVKSFLCSSKRPDKNWGSIKWAAGPLSLGVKLRGSVVDYSHHLVSKLRMNRDIVPLSYNAFMTRTKTRSLYQLI